MSHSFSCDSGNGKPVTLRFTDRCHVPYVDNFPVLVGRKLAKVFSARTYLTRPACSDLRISLVLRAACELPHWPVPRLRTASAACLHSLSTGLYTTRLDATACPAADCRTCRLQRIWDPA